MKCLLDLDGVLVDFVGGICRAHGQPNIYADGKNRGLYGMEEIMGLSATKFWEPANEEFWASLDWMPDGREILAAAEEAFGANNVCLLTSPSLNVGATAGKVRWIYEHVPDYKRRFLIGAAKEFCAHDDAVLIDDYEVNIKKFAEHGGDVILVGRPWNSRSHIERPLELLKLEIAEVAFVA